VVGPRLRAVLERLNRALPLEAITAAVAGSGAVSRFSAVHWGVARNIVTAWVLTFPICGVMGYIFALVLHAIF